MQNESMTTHGFSLGSNLCLVCCQGTEIIFKREFDPLFFRFITHVHGPILFDSAQVVVCKKNWQVKADMLPSYFLAKELIFASRCLMSSIRHWFTWANIARNVWIGWVNPDYERRSSLFPQKHCPFATRTLILWCVAMRWSIRVQVWGCNIRSTKWQGKIPRVRCCWLWLLRCNYGCTLVHSSRSILMSLLKSQRTGICAIDPLKPLDSWWFIATKGWSHRQGFRNPASQLKLKYMRPRSSAKIKRLSKIYWLILVFRGSIFRGQMLWFSGIVLVIWLINWL